MYKEYVAHIAKALVTEPEQVVVDAAEDTAAITVRLRVAPGDVGRVIGRQGITAQAMRALLHAIGARHQRRVTLEIFE